VKHKDSFIFSNILKWYFIFPSFVFLAVDLGGKWRAFVPPKNQGTTAKGSVKLTS